MPIFEYQCDAGHKFERLFLTFKAAEKESKETLCDVCHFEVAERLISAPGQPILYGDGFYKPAASGKSSTKTVDATKFIKDNNITVSGINGEKVDRKMLEKEFGARKRARRSK